jgi:carbonic anhydrase
MLALRRVTDGADLAALRELFSEYARAVRAPECFAGFDEELRRLPDGYDALFLATADAVPAACAALRRLDEATAEMKRLYVRAAHRGAGLGRRLADEAIRVSREWRCRRLVLDTLPHMGEAHALYDSLGFRETAPYLALPTPGARCFELAL